MTNLVNELKQEALNKFKDESDIKKFLDNLVHFNKYSFNNQLLIWLQDSDAKFVASKTTYNKMGYRVNKNYDDGIKIFMPKMCPIVKITDNDGNVTYKPYFSLTEEEKEIYKDKENDSIVFYKNKLVGFCLGNVFNANDTDMPMDVINEELSPVVDNTRAKEVINPLIKAVYKDGFKVQFEELDGECKGYTNYENNLIVIQTGLGSLMQLKVLIHEYAHALAHKHLKDNMKEYKEHRNKYETEAESISYVVSNYLGVSTNGNQLAYIYNWSKDKDFKEIDDSFSTIVNYSKKIISNFEKFYNCELDKDSRAISV